MVEPEHPGQDQGPASSSSASESPTKEPKRKQIRVQDRAARYVVVELPGGIARLHKAGREGCWMGRKRAFRSSREFVQAPARFEYTHVCKLCWPQGDRESGSEATEGVRPLLWMRRACPKLAPVRDEGRSSSIRRCWRSKLTISGRPATQAKEVAKRPLRLCEAGPGHSCGTQLAKNSAQLHVLLPSSLRGGLGGERRVREPRHFRYARVLQGHAHVSSRCGCCARTSFLQGHVHMSAWACAVLC